jgi:two-component system sensor histidine kinase ResE
VRLEERAVQVAEANRAKSRFLANVSHELRTPLTSIRGFAQAMQDGTIETAEERLRAARVIDAESRRVLQLVGELLDLSRIESGQQGMALADVPAAELLAHAAEVFAVRAREQDVTLAVEAGSAGVVRADFDRVEQVLANLMDNALRHTPTGGRVTLSAHSSPGGMVTFTVADTGEGVASADLPHVFDRFYRSALGQPEMPGAGLGLAISREIVRAHGGEIRAAARDGGGAEFSFTLSVATDAATEGAPRTSPAPSHDELATN